jgi:hypothetical protein
MFIISNGGVSSCCRPEATGKIPVVRGLTQRTVWPLAIPITIPQRNYVGLIAVDETVQFIGITTRNAVYCMESYVTVTTPSKRHFVR